MTQEMTDAEWLREYAKETYWGTDRTRLLSIAAKLEQQEKPVREVPEIVTWLKAQRYIAVSDGRSSIARAKPSFDLMDLAYMLCKHFEKDAK